MISWVPWGLWMAGRARRGYGLYISVAWLVDIWMLAWEMLMDMTNKELC